MPSVKEFKKAGSRTSVAAAKLQLATDALKKQTLKKLQAKRRPGRDAQENKKYKEQEKMAQAKKTKQEQSMEENETINVKTHSTKSTTGHDEGWHTADDGLDINNPDTTTTSSTTSANANSNENAKKVEISFFGSEILRAKLPKPFAVVEKVATDWVNNGTFENLNTGNSTADALAQQGLQKAKEIEKKVIDSGVIEKWTMQALTYGLKAQEEINNIRDQVKSKLGKK